MSFMVRRNPLGLLSPCLNLRCLNLYQYGGPLLCVWVVGTLVRKLRRRNAFEYPAPDFCVRVVNVPAIPAKFTNII